MLSPYPTMDSNTNCQNDLHTPTSPPCNMKLGTLDDEYCIENSFTSSRNSSTYLQDFQHLDKISMIPSSFNIKANSFDPFDPFIHGSSSDFNSNPFEENGYGITMQSLQGVGGGIFSDYSNGRNPIINDTTVSFMYYNTSPLTFLAPDESSCVTPDNVRRHRERGQGKNKKGRIYRSTSNVVEQNNNSKDQCDEAKSVKNSVRGRKKGKSGKGQWTAEEDRLLIQLVEKYGIRKWSNIAQIMKGRIGKQCRERWHNHLRPDIKKETWTEDEDSILVRVHAEVGNKWAEIAKSLPGRTENSIKNHWNATKRRQLSRRKCRTKWPRPSSILQNYIKRLGIEKPNDNERKSKDVQLPPTHSGNNLGTSLVRSPKNHQAFKSCHDDQMVADYDHEFDDVPNELFDHVFEMSDMDGSFMSGSMPEVGDELPFDIPTLMNCDVEEFNQVI